MKQSLPFETVVPLRILGANGQKPFCSIISQGKLIYTAGSTIVLENIKTQQQKILYTHSIPGETHLIAHHTTIYNQHFLAIALKHQHTLMHTVVIIPLNSAILSHHQDRKSRYKVHQLKYVEQYESIDAVHFFEQGSAFGVVSSYDKTTNFSLLRSSNGYVSYRETFMNTKVIVASAFINKLSCIAILLQDNKDGTRLCLIAADELSRKFYYSLNLEKYQMITQYVFEASPDESSYLIALTNTGFVLFFKINEFQIIHIARINVKIATNEEENEMNFSSDKLMPQSIQVAGNKIVVSYSESKVLLLLQYSVLNPLSHKRVLLRNILSNRPNLQSVHSIRISKDGCSLAALFLVNPQKLESLAIKTQPQTTKLIPASISSNSQISQSWIREQTCRDLDIIPRDQYVALQIDLLSNLIDHSQKQNSVSPTLTTIAGQASVRRLEYCPHSNTMFLLLRNKTIKYYNMSPSKGSRGREDYRLERLHLWTVSLGDQPVGLAAHPFNFSMLILYSDIIKFHNYNCKTLFPAFLVTPVKHCRQAAFSPLGDKIVLASNNTFTILDSYTFRTLNQVDLPNMLLQPSSQNILPEPKAINDFLFTSNDDLLFLSGHNTLTEAVNLDKAVHFGFLQADEKIRTAIQYDPVNKLAVVALAQGVLVLSKATLNSNSRCEAVCKLQVQATALLQIAELGVFFLGCKDGSLNMIQWPNYSQQDLYLQGQHKTHIFDEPIRSLFVTPSKTYLYAVSESGSIAICQLKIQDSENISNEIKQKMVKMADIPLMKLEHWLISKSDEERKERQLIKLRGEEADLSNNGGLGKEDNNGQDKKIHYKKQQFQQTYLTEIKQYENELGLQQITQKIQILKDQFRLLKKKQERQKAEIYKNQDKELKQVFKERKKLETQFSQEKQTLKDQQQLIKKDFQLQLKFLKEDFEQQSKIFAQKYSESQLTEAEKRVINSMEKQQIQQLNQQCLDNLRNNFKVQWQKNVEEGQTILAHNRNTNIARYCILDKMSDINLKKQELQYDLRKVNQQKQYLLEKQKNLEQQLDNNSQTYHKLVKCSRELEEQLVNERRITSKVHDQLVELTKEVATLQQKNKQVEKQYQQINYEFIQQRQHSEQSNKNLQKAQQKLQNLKSNKKQALYKSSIARARIEQTSKTLQRQLQTEEQSVVQQLRKKLCQEKGLIQQNQLGIFYDKQKDIIDTASKNAVKWIHLKQNYYGGFRRNYNKLQNQYMKLTYQYNDLFKVSQQYRTTLNHLEEKIQMVKSQPALKSRKMIRSKVAQSFLHKPNQVPPPPKKPYIKQKGVCVSLHQQTGKFITEAD